MEFVPPVSVRRVGDRRFLRFIVRDGGGHCWTGRSWSEDPAEAMLYLRESDAMRAGLHLHEFDGATDAFTVQVVVSVTRDAWRREELIEYLKSWARLLMMKNQENRAIRIEIDWDKLEEDEVVPGL
jgi:hypothetical protein